MSYQEKWIKPSRDFGDICPVYVKKFTIDKTPEKATLTLTAFGVYEAVLNGVRVGDFILAPGWTVDRLQVQEYDVTHLLKAENTLEITVGRGWYRSPLMGSGWQNEEAVPRLKLPPGLWAKLSLDALTIETDSSWQVTESPVRFSEIYDGEHFDAQMTPSDGLFEAAQAYAGPDVALLPQQGEQIREIDRIRPAQIFTTPQGEQVIDFGQNITGYVEIVLPESTKAGQEVLLSFAEVMDKEGNFYTENYRAAKSKMHYICREGAQSYKPKFTFYGFRYIRVDEYPAAINLDNFIAITVHSDMLRTGWLESSDGLLNRLFDNVIWGQKGNFLDVPTDCPQRDERLGWTGDAQVFIKTASYNYDVEKFFIKWLADLSLSQTPEGRVPHVVPDCLNQGGSAAWGDAATICPWQLYLTYGNKAILESQFASMTSWLDFIKSNSNTPNLWIGGQHFGDWLSLDLPPGEESASASAARHDFIASAFYAFSCELVIKAGKVIGRDVVAYEALYQEIVAAFRAYFPDYKTQTEYVLALQFNLVENPQAVADALATRIVEDGTCLKTGFVGTPYILHQLSRYGYTELAYTLLLRQDYPSWLYPVTKGATTIWERWDSIKPDGSFQSAGMNSFNHYAYGAVADWVYGVAAGIDTVEEAPGFAKIRVAPQPDARLNWLKARIDTRAGTVVSTWEYVDTDGKVILQGQTPAKIRYEMVTPSPTEIVIDGVTYQVEAGSYVFFGNASF